MTADPPRPRKLVIEEATLPDGRRVARYSRPRPVEPPVEPPVR